MMQLTRNPYESKNNSSQLKINLRFFAAEGTGGEKTEQASSKKKEKARSEGQVALSPEVATAFLYIVMFSSINIFAPTMFKRMQTVFLHSFDVARNYKDILDPRFASKLVAYMFFQSIMTALPLLLVTMAVGIVSNVLQVGWNPTTKTLKPKFSNLNPINGIKRLFSVKAVVNLFKSLFKMIIIGLVIYGVLKNELENIPGLVNLTLLESVVYIGKLIVNLGITVGGWFIAVALVDFAYTKFKHNKDLMMTKYEVKQEYKESEGDPQIKGKIRQRMHEASQRRMMQSVPSADVIITNPTHYAVAIKYDREGSGAPQVVAKGVDFIAKRIKEVAIENKVEIVENVQLARTLYATVDVGKEIPTELYQAVAEILAFVYKLKNKVS